MRATPKLLLAAVLAGTVLAGLPATQAAAATPKVTVSPGTNLTAGRAVAVTASGLPANTEVTLQQCPDEPYNDGSDEAYCTNRRTLTTNGAGRLRTRWTIEDPVYFRYPFGDPEPRYCRADGCRMWITTPDGTNHASAPMTFRGSPATVTATPATGLTDGATVRVAVTAKGTTGRSVRLIQQACFSIIQGAGCQGPIDLGTYRLARNDTAAIDVMVSRYLADGSDCADDLFYGPCGITVEVLDAAGNPDDSFGVARLGDPSADLAFTATS